ncbi:flagellar biosynthetic protein FliP [Variovorax sp. OV700]|nr:flagellar biosynthetic protein FliP [Variovorax sp. OV700]
MTAVTAWASTRKKWCCQIFALLLIFTALVWVPLVHAQVESREAAASAIGIETGLDGNVVPPPVPAASALPQTPAAASPGRAKVVQTAPRAQTPALTTPATETAQALRVVLGLTVLALLPALLVCLTSFLRIIVVLSMLRHAIGMNETPPNTVLIGLALFLTLFTMSPVLQKLNQDAFEPFMAGKLSVEEGYGKGIAPLRDFMVRQTREADLALMVELSKAPVPRSLEDISNVQLIPSFMLSELRAAFQIGFVIFLPFLLIDLIVSSILMALGMMMMPPTTIALPLKILMFILVDGWSLVLKALVGSFH